MLLPTAPYDLCSTTRLLRLGANDPTFVRSDGGLRTAFHTPEGPVQLVVRGADPGVELEAWGPGAGWAELTAPRLLGLHEAPWTLPDHDRISAIHHRHQGLRLTDTGRVFEGLIGIILQQQVTWQEAVNSWRQLVQAVNNPAPGPPGLLLPPSPTDLRRFSLGQLQSFGIGRQRAETLQRIGPVAKRLEEAAAMETPEAWRRLTAVRGIGPWTAASVLGHRLGRPDVVIRGDLHLPNTVVWAFESVHRGTDEDVDRLLTPFAGQEFRVLRLLYADHVQAPRHGPRRAIRWSR